LVFSEKVIGWFGSLWQGKENCTLEKNRKNPVLLFGYFGNNRKILLNNPVEVRLLPTPPDVLFLRISFVSFENECSTKYIKNQN
jgi:hypothetical protein